MLGLWSLRSLMSDTAWASQALLQWLSTSPTRWRINREIGEARSTFAGPKLCTYLRYDVFVDEAWIAGSLGETVGPADLALLTAMDRPEGMDLAWRLGEKAAAAQVKPEHFPETFALRQ
jgi:hypothetical protein